MERVAEQRVADLLVAYKARETFQESYKAMQILTSARSPILHPPAIKMPSRQNGYATPVDYAKIRKPIVSSDAVHHTRPHGDSLESAASYASNGPGIELSTIGVSELESSSESDCTLSRNGSITSTDSSPVSRLVLSNKATVSRHNSAPYSFGHLQNQSLGTKDETRPFERRFGDWRSDSDERKNRVRFEDSFEPTSESSNGTPSDNETGCLRNQKRIDVDEKPLKIERIRKNFSQPNLLNTTAMRPGESGHVRKASCPEFMRNETQQEAEPVKSKSGFRKFGWQIGERGTPKLTRKLSFQGERDEAKVSERKVSEPLPEYQPAGSSTPDKGKSVWKVFRRKVKKEKKSSVESMEGSGSFSGMPDHGYGEKLGTRYRLLSPARRQGSSFSESESGESPSQPYVPEATKFEELRYPDYPFSIWSEGKVDIDLGSDTLPLLHVAAGEGNLELLKTLVGVGVDIDEGDEQGWPAVHYAVCTGHFNCANYLIARGANMAAYSLKVTNHYCASIRNAIRTSHLNS